MDLGINSKFCLTQHQKTDFYNLSGECLQRGTDWVRLHCIDVFCVALRTNSNFFLTHY